MATLAVVVLIIWGVLGAYMLIEKAMGWDKRIDIYLVQPPRDQDKEGPDGG